MALEVNGKLIRVMNPVTGEGRNGSWTKQEFVVETFDQYPKKICMSVWGEKVDALRRFQIGDDVKVSINLESREYNERWYTEVRAWKIDSLAQAAQGMAPNPGFAQPAAAPGYNPSAGQSPSPSFQPASQQNDDFFKSDESDDLPF